MKIPNLVYLYLDLEVIAPIDVVFPAPELAEYPIGAISFYDTMNQTFVTLYLDDNKHAERIDLVYNDKKGNILTTPWFKLALPNEVELLQVFIEMFIGIDPDIISIWNKGFDMPYLHNRCKNLGVNIRDMSPTGNVDEESIEGRLIIDMLWGYKIIRNPLSDGLDYAAKNEGFKGKYGTTRDAIDAFETNKHEFCLYSVHDIRMMVQIDLMSVGVTFFFQERKNAAGMPDLMESSYNSILVDTVGLRLARYLGLCLPSKPKKEKGAKKAKSYKGAIVIEAPEPGVYDNIATFDFEKYYNMILEVLNLSKETIDPDGDIVFGDLKLTSKQIGFAVLLYFYFREQRYIHERRMKSLKVGTVEYEVARAKFQNFKDLSNSVWGWISYVSGRLYDRQLAKTITKMGRYGILWVKRRAEKKGYRVVSGDTDSIMVEFKKHDVKKMIEFGEYLESTMPALIEKATGRKGIKIGISLERISRRMCFVERGEGGKGVAKKRRFERNVWEKGQDCDYLRIVGFEYKRRDSSLVIKDMQLNVMTMIAYEKEDEVFDYVHGLLKEFDPEIAVLDNIKMSMGLGKFLKDYGGINKKGHKKSVPQHARAAKYSNDHLKKDYDIGSQLNFIFIKRMPYPYPQTNVLAFDEQEDIPIGTIIDYEAHLDKMRKKVEKLLNILGISWELVVRGDMGLIHYAK